MEYLDPALSLADAARKAAEILRRPGAVLLVPTETVYGLVCRADDRRAVDRIYAMKHREPAKPLALFTADAETLPGIRLTPLARRLAQQFCPGAITIIVDGDSGKTVGFRTPDHPFILALLSLLDFPLASTSANRSGMPNVLTPQEALEELAELPDAVVQGGTLPENALASTVVDARGEKAVILRQGALQIPAEFL